MFSRPDLTVFNCDGRVRALERATVGVHLKNYEAPHLTTSRHITQNNGFNETSTLAQDQHPHGLGLQRKLLQKKRKETDDIGPHKSEMVRPKKLCLYRSAYRAS